MDTASMSPEPSPPMVASYLEGLRLAGFAGEIATDHASRLVVSTDNSIYQVLPQAVIFPKSGDDLSVVMKTANQPEFVTLKLYPRGGGTSMNGQTLGPGVVIDTSRHMRRILEFDADKRLIKVEPGLVRDGLIDFLKPHGLFFAPHVSTTSRATIGGMVSNDSSGMGSVVHGKTSRHIEALEIILPNGQEMEIKANMPVNAIGAFEQKISDIIAPHHDEIDKVFPKLVRQFTGYNLKEARDRNGSLHLTMLIAGSEGTLCLIKSVTCRVLPLPVCKGLVAVRYPSNDAGFKAITDILKTTPSAVEFIDGNILAMAELSPFADNLARVLGVNPGDAEAGAVHFVEFQAENDDALNGRINELSALLEKSKAQVNGAIGWRVALDATQISSIWDMRRASQGLLAPESQNEQAVAFVEDCVVPPENLADFAADLENALKARGIKVGMFGHADVGCVHMRPALDLTKESHRQQIRDISDEVFALTRKYAGMLWGEHGKGLRSEFSERLLGSKLFGVMGEIKQLFDPGNRMNPGKVAVPHGSEDTIIRIDNVPMRGHFNQQITPDLQDDFAKALRCNGNGACFTLDAMTPLCPSYKATGDRRYSPKGRAEILREWIRLRSNGDADANAIKALSNEVLDTMQTCLACKSCAGAGCLFRVDIPTMRARFLEWYYRFNRRPLGDYAVIMLERIAPMLARLPRIVNAVQSLGIVKAVAARAFGLVDLPKLSTKTLARGLNDLNLHQMNAQTILDLPAASRAKMVVIVQDCFTSFYDSSVVLAQASLVQELGFKPVLLTYREGGKPLHVQGFIDRFDRVANANAADLSALSAAGLALLGVDVAVTLMYRHEYKQVNTNYSAYNVQLLSEWLAGIDLPHIASKDRFKLLQHCTEKSLQPETTSQWVSIFARVGLQVELVKTGCCGMSGLFGHQSDQQEMSRTLYDQSWREIVEGETQIMATGYSCRSQIKRLSHMSVKQPGQVLLEALQKR